MKFDFEDFPVYKEAIHFYEKLDRFLELLPEKRTKRIIDQIERAAISISLNIAEGAGRYHKADKRNYYIIAKGSTYECIACLQILKTRNLISEEKYNDFYDSLGKITKQLFGLIKII